MANNKGKGNTMLTKQDITVLSELLDQGLKPVREDLNRLHKDFEGLNNKFNGLRQDMNEKIEGLRTEMYQLIGDLREERYSESVERQKKMEEDISVMKDVIQEHSVQLQKLCS